MIISQTFNSCERAMSVLKQRLPGDTKYGRFGLNLRYGADEGQLLTADWCATPTSGAYISKGIWNRGMPFGI